MKKFVIRVTLFFVFLFVIDRVSGFGLSYLSEHSKGGYTARHNYITDGLTEDLLIFGSSRAIHNYNPYILEDSLGLTSYNCGEYGNGIILLYGWWQIIREHYQPKMIIYDVIPSYDIGVFEDNHKFLGWLKESYDRADVRDIFESIDPTEKYKMVCQLYRYNSKWHQIITDYIHPIYIAHEKGFDPLVGNFDVTQIENTTIGRRDSIKYDSIKIKYLKKFASSTGDVKLIFTVSPKWNGIPSQQLQPIKEICQQNGIPFLDFSNDTKYYHNNAYFIDRSHMNISGANEFTRDLIEVIKRKKII